MSMPWRLILGALICSAALLSGCKKKPPIVEIPPCDCNAIRQQAVLDCGSEENLTSFSCDPATCIYSYSCNNYSGGIGGLGETQTQTSGGY
jgi:hypothetical protein